MSENSLMSIHADMHQHHGYWILRITAEKVDAYGTGEITVGIRKSAQMPELDRDIDQVWVALVQLVHLVEANGSVGRISSRVDEPLF